MTSPNRAYLTRVVRRLGPLADAFVFVGGQVAELLITDPAAVRVRATDDVDVICTVRSRSDYQALGDQLRAIGFREDTREGAPICRWVLEGDVLDVMPADPTILNMPAGWFTHAVRSAVLYVLEEGLSIRIPSAPAFLATKWEALQDRDEDWRWSRHAEDIVKIVAGRPELLGEVRIADPDIVAYLCARARQLLASGDADDVVAAALPDAGQVPNLIEQVKDRFVALSEV